jgi:putative membrane protein
VTPLAHAEASAGWLEAAPLLALTALLGAAYVVCAARAPRGWSAWRTASWLAGCGTVAIALSPLVAAAAGPSAHMAQRLLLGMLAPLGLVLAAPMTLVLRVASRRGRRAIAAVLHSRAVRLLGHPVSAALLSTGGLFVVMLTPLYALAEATGPLHLALHVHYLGAGCLFVWAIAGPDPAPGRASMPVRVAVLVAAAGAHAFPAQYLYAHADTPPTGTAGGDVSAFQDAAQVMYYGGDAAELLLTIALFGGWYTRRARRFTRVQRTAASQAAA